MAMPDKTEVTWAETLDLIESDEELSVRIAAVASDTAWQVRLMDIVHGVEPPEGRPDEWRYEEIHFRRLAVTGKQVADWFRAGAVAAGSDTYALPPQTGTPVIRWERKSSGAQTWFERLGWPTIEATLQGRWSSQLEPPGPFVGDGLPSFLTFYYAAGAFFLPEGAFATGTATPKIAYRSVDRTGRIRSVRIGGDYIDVEVEGHRLGDLTLELAGDRPGQTQKLNARSAPEVHRFGLPNGLLPSGAWVLLKSGSRWVDRRVLTYPFRRGTDEGVEIVVDPLTKLEAFLASYERHGVEFKVKVPKTDDEKLRMFKTAAAFANGDDGGSILVGVSDDRDLVGIDAAKATRDVDTLTQMLREWVTPAPPHSFEPLPFGDGSRVIIELRVTPGPHLYGAGRPNPTIYIRPFSTTEKARPNEIEDLARRRLGTQKPTGLPLGGHFNS